MREVKKFIETIIFAAKWILIPFYLGLFITMFIYTYVYIEQIIHLLSITKGITRDEVLLTTLELVDIVMIANLIKMIITGSYNSFVDKRHGYAGENVSSNMLKIKISTSIIGVSAVHLLQTFINSENVSMENIKKQLAIHCTFLIGAFVLAMIDFLHAKSEHIHPSHPDAHLDAVTGTKTAGFVSNHVEAADLHTPIH